MLGKNCFWADEITIQKKQTNKKTTTKIDPNADTLFICIQKQGPGDVCASLTERIHHKNQIWFSYGILYIMCVSWFSWSTD